MMPSAPAKFCCNKINEALTTRRACTESGFPFVQIEKTYRADTQQKSACAFDVSCAVAGQKDQRLGKTRRHFWRLQLDVSAPPQAQSGEALAPNANFVEMMAMLWGIFVAAAKLSFQSRFHRIWLTQFWRAGRDAKPSPEPQAKPSCLPPLRSPGVSPSSGHCVARRAGCTRS
jgi:hypothetical protein